MTNEELAGRIDAVSLFITTMMLEGAVTRANFTGEEPSQALESVIRKVERLMPGLLGEAERLGQPQRSAGLERQVEFVAALARQAGNLSKGR